MKMTNDDRRRFFRITDAIGVSYALIKDGQENSEEGVAPVEKGVNVNQLLESHNLAVQSALDDLESTSSVAANAIAALNKKLDIIVSLIGLDNLAAGMFKHSTQEASISACGIAFPVDESMSSDVKINLTLFLETSGEQVAAVGRVIDCQSLDEEGLYYLRVEFIEMKDNDREKLIQHIMQRQGTLLRSLKEQFE